MTNAKYQMTNQCQMPNILAVSNVSNQHSVKARIQESGDRKRN